MLRGRGRQLGATHLGESAASPLKNRAAFQNLRDAIALQQLAGWLLPRIQQERGAIDVGDRSDDARLQTLQITADRFGLSASHGHGAHAAAPLTAR